MFGTQTSFRSGFTAREAELALFQDTAQIKEL
jgi:hypothetical protein